MWQLNCEVRRLFVDSSGPDSLKCPPPPHRDIYWTGQASLPTQFDRCSCVADRNLDRHACRGRVAVHQPHGYIVREILQTCTMRTDVVSNFPPPRWIGTLVMLTKLDCQWAFTLILLVCSPLGQAYRHGNEVGRTRERKRERWIRLCWHGLASVQHAHTHTHGHDVKYTYTSRESSKVCPDGILLRCTALFKGFGDSVNNTVRSTEGHHQLVLIRQPGRCSHQFKRFRWWTYSKWGIFLIYYSWLQKVAFFLKSDWLLCPRRHSNI